MSTYKNDLKQEKKRELRPVTERKKEKKKEIQTFAKPKYAQL